MKRSDAAVLDTRDIMTKMRPNYAGCPRFPVGVLLRPCCCDHSDQPAVTASSNHRPGLTPQAVETAIGLVCTMGEMESSGGKLVERLPVSVVTDRCIYICIAVLPSPTSRRHWFAEHRTSGTFHGPDGSMYRRSRRWPPWRRSTFAAASSGRNCCSLCVYCPVQRKAGNNGLN